MYLQKLVINGFKSFVKKTVFSFDHSFVAIVGPNGGGKTNVVDALRWVMGEQSPKLLRLKKAEDAIFAGSKKMARLGLAQVDLYINNEDKRLPLDYSEVVISRKLFRNGESEYSINKKVVRLVDIILLLAKANFGQKSYAVIGQGMIADILNANPQDRKEFFDEATGVKEFQIKRDQAINKLIRTEENLMRAEDLLQEIEPRLRSLQRQVRKLEKRKEIEAELHQSQIKYYGSLWQELLGKLTIISQQKKEACIQKDKCLKNQEEIQALIDQVSQEESRTSVYQKLQQQYNDLLSSKNKLLKEQIILHSETEIEQKKQGELNLVWLQRKKEEISSTVNRQKLEIEHLVGASSQLEIKLQDKLEQEKRLQKDFSELEYNLLKAKEALQKATEILSVSEISERLVGIFNQQENFLKRLLNTHDLGTFKETQKEAKIITEAIASLLDELHGKNNEEISAQKKTIEILQNKLSEQLDRKERQLLEINELRIKIQSQKEKQELWKDNIIRQEQEKNDIDKEITSIQNSKKEQSQDKIKQIKLDTEQKIARQINTLEEELLLVQEKINKFNEEEEYKKQKMLRLQNQLRDQQQETNQVQEKINLLEIESVRYETKKEDIDQEINKEVPAEKIPDIKSWQGVFPNRNEISVLIANYQHQLELIGSIDQETIAEHATTKERFDFLHIQSKDLRKTIVQLDQIIDELDKTIKKQFDLSFKAIAANFSRYFQIIFNGGQAKLSLVMEEAQPEPDPLNNGNNNPVENPPISMPAPSSVYESIGKKKKKQRIISGIDIEAMPPGKKVKNVQSLSGGEKSMTAIALICSIIAANTPPFVVLDEVEAALDEANSEKFATIIKQLSTKTQFITITHNRATMHYADILYGVTMGHDGVSNILSVKLEEAQKMVNEKKD